MQENTEQPLISIVVITYNSSKFVIETLESAKAQTYQNIELIVSDDFSTDATVDICKAWIDNNRYRFVSATLVTAGSNTGIPANLNRGVNLSKGLWIKYIAGDDLLSENCLTELMHYVDTEPEEIKIVSTDVVVFSGEAPKSGEIKKNPFVLYYSKNSSPKDQYEKLLRTNIVFSATVMIRRDLLAELNGFDERFKFLEDWPLWVKITSAGYKMHYLEKPLIYYRSHDNNLSQTVNKNFLYHPVNKIAIDFKRKELLKRLPFIERMGLRHDLMGIRTCFFLGNNRKNPLTRFVFHAFNILNPFYNYLRLRKLLHLRTLDL